MSKLWLACEYPERPTDPYVVWHQATLECRGCQVKAQMLLKTIPDLTGVELRILDGLLVQDPE